MKTWRITERGKRRSVWRAVCGTFILLGVFFLVGCSQDDPEGSEDNHTAVVFNAGIGDMSRVVLRMPDCDIVRNNVQLTRTTGGGDSWETTDRVGIFMLHTSGRLTTAADVLAVNKQYGVADAGTGVLSPTDGTPIYYPQAGNVDFVAYYPYGTTGTGAGQIGAGYLYNISVAGQVSETVQNALDVLYAKTTNVSKSETIPVNFIFSHVLSKVTLNVNLEEELTPLSGAEITAAIFSGMPQTATLALQDGALTAGTIGNFAALKRATPLPTYVATFTALLVPQPQTGTGDFAGRMLVFTVDGAEYTWMIPDTETFIAGHHYTYSVTVNKSGIEIGAPLITPWNENNTYPSDMTPLEIAVVRIPAAGKTFLMGSSDGTNGGNGLNTTAAEPNRGSDETQHRVTLTRNFYMSRYEITNAQFAGFLNAINADSNATFDEVDYPLGKYPAVQLVKDCSFETGFKWGVTYIAGEWVPMSGYEDHPVIFVSWYGADEYANWVGGVLPTEAQWEFACRGGEDNKPFGIGTGYTLDNTLANFSWSSSWSWDGVSQSATIGSTGGTPPGKTQVVGTYMANSFGLYDMHGNVSEWCRDFYNIKYGSENASDDVIDPVCRRGTQCVMRGGHWSFGAQRCRSASRNYMLHGDPENFIGFRVVFIP